MRRFELAKEKTQPLFETGRIQATPGALETLSSDGDDILSLVGRHVAGDWSEMSAEDQQANRRSLADGTRIFSAYRTRNENRIWIITEADRSATTVLLPEEY